jgi:exonuclease SbcC
MIPHSLLLRGFKGIRAGIGLVEIFIDLTVLPDGVIAIAGENGRGKTTVLDNLHPYRIMPYKLRKKKDWSPNSFSFYDQCFGNDACKELVFEMPGKGLFKSLVMIDADRKKQEAYLYEQAGEGWKPLNDGKTGTYDEIVEQVVGSPTLYFSSVFRAQGAKNLSDYTRGDIVGILAELLNIDHIREQGEKARSVVTELRNRVDLTRASVRSAQDDVDAAALVQVDLLAAEGRLPELQAGVTAAQVKLDEAQCVVNRCNAEEASRQSEVARGVLIRSQITDEQNRHDGELLRLGSERREALQRQNSETVSHDADVLAITDRISQARTSSGTSLAGQLQVLNTRIADARTASDRTLTEQVAVIDARLARARKIVSGADQIRAAVVKETDAEALLARLTPEQTEAGALLSRLHLKQADSGAALTTAQGVLHTADVAHLTAKQAVQAATTNIAKLEGIDCKGDGSNWINSTCRFVASAAADRDALAGLMTAVENALRDQEAAKESVLQAQALHDADKLSVQQAQETVNRLRGEVEAVNTNLVTLRAFTKLLPELEQAEEVIKVAEAELVTCRETAASALSAIIVQLEADIVACREKHETDLATLVQQLEADLEARKKRYATFGDEIAARLRTLGEAEQAEISQHQQALDRLNLELLTIPEYDDLSATLERAQADAFVAQADVNRNNDAVRALEGEIAGYRAVLASVEGKRQVLLEADAQIERLQAWIADFSLLVVAMPGVEALELDDAAPSIAVNVNDLLMACYGSRFSVRFDTQAEKADGTKREAFDILVYDSELDSERSITEMSGGQTCWIEDAITRGISLFNIHRADRAYGALFSDEKDGALSPDRKMEFFAVKRAALEIGHHTREFFITQTVELIDMADARIEMLPGRVLVQ